MATIMKPKYIILYLITAFTVSILMPSCVDDGFDTPDYTVSGEDVLISVPVMLPKMDKKTRADLSETSLNQVNNLWIRTYSSVTGLPTSDWKKLTDVNTVDSEVPHPVNLNTKSGSSYIVGVANVDENEGVLKDSPNAEPKPLSELLDNADTWNDFLNIAVVSPATMAGVRAPNVPLAMAGCFTNISVKGEHPTNLADWQSNNFTPYFIPAQKGTVSMTDGAIHLRRLVSHLTFNVIPGRVKDDGPDVDVSVNSYEIVNAPKYSWLYERSQTVRGGDGANFGDNATSQDNAAQYYAEGILFSSQYVSENKVTVEGTEKNCSTFDFWQAENKHEGTSTTYFERDKVDASNKTLFTSLTGQTWTPNNEASYVLISCTVNYKQQISVNEQGEIVKNDGTEVYRSGNAVYMIHLGYIGDVAEDAKSKDFNCYRNVDYTYNITVNGLNDIRVDAYATDETYHGEEGLVSDLQNSTIELDAHYHAFNIKLTEEELKQKNFGFIITTYENGKKITVSDLNVKNGQIVDEAGNEVPAKYYNWIELRATKDEKTLADYKPSNYNNYLSDEKHTFLLSDLRGDESRGVGPWDNGMTDDMKSDSEWYTVFVNEYTYETDADESSVDGSKPNWTGYVNQNPRRFYIRVARKTSPDGNSVYARSKYGVSQQSVQTYYSLSNLTPVSTGFPLGTAIGVERFNETEGLNMRVTFAGGNSTVNGRWNVAQWLDNNNTTTNPSINSTDENGRPAWSNFVSQNSPMEMPGVSGLRLQGGPALPARTIEGHNPLPLPAVITRSGTSYSFNDPQASSSYIEAINACMSRNRDNNGNGRIDPDELRWYVPAMGKYLRLILGGNSLNQPILNFSNVNKLPYANQNGFSENSANRSITNDYYPRYMFVSSNSGVNVLWAMEGTSTSLYDKVYQWSGNNSRPWQVRCIRNLGTDLSSVGSDDKVTMAYVHDGNTRTVRMSYYDLASVRPNKYTSNNGSDAMPLHTINSDYNMVYKAFEYASDDIKVTRTDIANATSYATYINGNPCNVKNTDTSTGWRVPNQKELTILRNAGVFNAHQSYTTWLSCTVGYFNYSDGQGNSSTANKYLLVMQKEQGVQLTNNNFNYAFGSIGSSDGMFVRCVRDIDY